MAISGLSKDTNKRLIFDAGAFFINYDIENDTLDTAMKKCIGATSGGGGNFEAVPEFRDIEIDGVKGKTKGSTVLDGWDVSMTANVVEFKTDTFRYAFGATDSEEIKIEDFDYTKIRGKNRITHCDYLDNITFMGNITGSSRPIIITVFNVLNEEGLSIDVVDKDNAVAELKFQGSYDPDNVDNPPFAIYYPKLDIDDTCELPKPLPEEK